MTCLQSLLDISKVHISFAYLQIMRSGPLIVELIDRGFLKSTRFLESDPYFQEINPISSKSRIYDMDLPFALSKIQEAFGVEGDPPQVLYEDRIWSLGHMVFEKRSYELIFARCLEEHITGIWLDNLLETRKDPTPLTLTSTMNSMILEKYSKRCPAFTLSELLGMQKKGLVWRKSRLKAGFSRSSLKVQEDFYVSPDFSCVVVRDKVYLFSGYLQRRVIEYLYHARQAGILKVRTQKMLEEIGAQTTQLYDLFKNHPARKKIIAYEGGFSWLEI